MPRQPARSTVRPSTCKMVTSIFPPHAQSVRPRRGILPAKPTSLLIAIDAEALGETLRYEPSRGGDLFPHLYAPLPLSAVRWTKPLPLGPDGHHVFPDLRRMIGSLFPLSHEAISPRAGCRDRAPADDPRPVGAAGRGAFARRSSSGASMSSAGVSQSGRACGRFRQAMRSAGSTSRARFRLCGARRRRAETAGRQPAAAGVPARRRTRRSSTASDSTVTDSRQCKARLSGRRRTARHRRREHRRQQGLSRIASATT